MSERMEPCCGGMLRRRICFMPTWRGWLCLGAAVWLTIYGLVQRVHSFLALNQPITAKVLVVDGWGADFALKAAIDQFHRGGYQQILVTGGPLEKGVPLAEFKTHAELGAATLRAMGFKGNLLAVPAPETKKDRTYVSALTLKRWLRERSALPARFNLLSTGPHARRSWLLFQVAFGPNAEIGVISVPDEHYDARRWWTTSLGFRTVVDEVVAYFYARVLFRPPAPADSDALGL